MSSFATSMIKHGLTILNNDGAPLQDAVTEGLAIFQALSGKDLSGFIAAAQKESADLSRILADLQKEFGF